MDDDISVQTPVLDLVAFTVLQEQVVRFADTDVFARFASNDMNVVAPVTDLYVTQVKNS
jgi:hypothetical protein